MESGGQTHDPAALFPGKEPPGTHWIRGWVGLSPVRSLATILIEIPRLLQMKRRISPEMDIIRETFSMSDISIENNRN